MKNRTDKNAINSQIVLICNKIKKVSKNELDDQRDLSLYFFDSDTLKIIKDISNGCKEKQNLINVANSKYVILRCFKT